MNKQYFGTDGIRGSINLPHLQPEFIIRLGCAIAQILSYEPNISIKNRPIVLIGRDPRTSSIILETALSTGLLASGVDVGLLGIVPTPAVAYATAHSDAQLGVVVTASHNPYCDNGIKLFMSDGSKPSEAIEIAIEQQLKQPFCLNQQDKFGIFQTQNDIAEFYKDFCKGTVSHLSLKGLSIVIDCANGATSSIVPDLFTELGAEVTAIAANPDGININQNCGSTSPQRLQKEVLEKQADLGIAFDGDGDRLVMVDQNGQLLDGDALLYIIASHRQASKRPIQGVVGTIMSNSGLEQALKQLKLQFQRASVGDHHVYQQLQEKNWMLGGEPSGHIILRDKSKTGDGILVALEVLEAMQQMGCSLEKRCEAYQKKPQILINIPIQGTFDLNDPILQDRIAKAEQQLGADARIVIRLSGTESVVRLMLEGADQQELHTAAESLICLLGLAYPH